MQVVRVATWVKIVLSTRSPDRRRHLDLIIPSQQSPSHLYAQLDPSYPIGCIMWLLA
jgi:hypothetical protein